MRIIILVLVSFLMLSLPLVGEPQETDASKKQDYLLSPLHLLPGYKMQVASGIDTWGGWILKDGGAKINFEHGYYDLPANTVEKSNIAWQEEQVVNGKQVLCLYTKANHFFVTIPRDMIFFEADIQSQKDLADVLLMAVTWDMTHGYPVEPGTIERLKKPTN
jgi:hypothetical protein